MDEQGKFYAVVWTLAAGVIISIVIGTTVNSIHDSDVMLEMVKAGANPLEARCAVSGGNGTSSMDCNILYSKR